jgi:hypothetical protein
MLSKLGEIAKQMQAKLEETAAEAEKNRKKCRPGIPAERRLAAAVSWRR